MVSGRCRFIKEWTEWDYAVHEDEAQIARQGKAMSYPFTFNVNDKTKTAQFSSTSDLPYYDTSLSQCSCYDFQKRNLPCKHMYRLAVELGVIEIIRRSSSNSDKNLLVEIKTSEDIDTHPEQIKRIKKAKEAKMTPLSIDYVNQLASFAGSGKKPYETTLDSCTCRDYFVRRLPCKHIYRLRMECGLLKEDFLSDSTVSNIKPTILLKEAVGILENLLDDTQLFLKELLIYIANETNKVWIECDEKQDLITNFSHRGRDFCAQSAKDIISLPFFVLAPVPAEEILPDMRKKDITALLDDIGTFPSENLKKDDLQIWCLENIPNLSNYLPKRFYVSCAPCFLKNIHKTRKYLERKFDWDCYYDNEMKPIRYPRGAKFEDVNVEFSIGEDGKCSSEVFGNSDVCHFPNDEITELLTLYGHNIISEQEYRKLGCDERKRILYQGSVVKCA